MIAFVIGNAVIDILVVICALIWLIFFSRNLNKLDNYFKYFIYFYILFYLTLVFSSLFSDYFDFSFPKSIVFLRFILFGLFLYSFYIKRITYFNKYLYSIVFVLLVIYFDSIIQFFFDTNLFGFQKINNFRISGPFNNELILGSFVLVFASIITLNTTKFNLFYFFILFLSLVIILLSGERVALIKFSIFHIIFFIYVIYKKKIYISIKALIFFLVSALVFTILMLHSNQLERHKQFVNKFIPGSPEFIFYSGHYSHFVSSILIFNENKFKGSGFRSFRHACKKNQGYFTKENIYDYQSIPDKGNDRINIIKSMNINLCSTNPHNLYLEVISESGILGFSAFILLLIYVFKKLIFFDLRLFLILYLFPLLSSPSLFHQKNSFMFTFIIVIMFLIRDYRNHLKQ